MRYWLRIEENKESPKHFQLLRDRELRCISGQEAFCDYWQSKFLAKDELWIENAPEGYMDSLRNRVRKPRTQREIEYRATLSALERVRSSMCNATDIIPDQSLKVHTTVGDYLSFQETPGGVSMRKRTPNQQRKETMFVRFLEGGPKGPVYGLLCLGELLSLALTPVSMPLYGIHYALGTVLDMVVETISECAEFSVTSDSNAMKSGNYNSSTPYKYPNVVSQACFMLNQTRVPGTAAFEVVQFFDYTSYSYPMYLLDNYISPLLKRPTMLVRLLWHAPIMYYDYYLGRRFLDLPPSRNTCLIRSGIANAEEEIEELRRRIREEHDVLMSLAAAEEDLGGKALLGDLIGAEEADKEVDEDRLFETDGAGRPSIYNFFATRFARKTRDAKVANRQRKQKLVDYGPTGDLEALKNLCLQSSGEGEMEFELCFYKYVSVDNLLLGRWLDWGPLPLETAHGGIGGAAATDNLQLNASITGDSNVASSSSGQSTLGWLGGLASAMRGIKVDQYQLHLEKKRTTPGYWQHQRYTDGAPCNGSAIPTIQTEAEDNVDRSNNSGDKSYRQVQVDLNCGVTSKIDRIHSSEHDVCTTILTVSTPLACTPEVEQDSLDFLDKLGVFGFTKRKSAVQAQEKTVGAVEDKLRASAQKQAERHSKTAETQKKRESEAFRAADLERKKKALGKIGKKKKDEKEKEKGEESEGKKKKKKDAERKKKKDKKAGKKGKKDMEMNKEDREAEQKKNKAEAGWEEDRLEAEQKRAQQEASREKEVLGGSVDIEVIQPADLETDADVFDSLPDDDDELEEKEQEIISLDGMKLVGGILRPEDLPIGGAIGR